MENYLSNNSKKYLLEIVNNIKSSEEYIKCLELKEELSKDKELVNLIEEVKRLQKKYISSNYSKELKEELDNKKSLLEKNKLFLTYNYYLDIVNQKIDIVKNELNNYFSSIVNIELF